jgi:hypothetical protein
VEGHLTKSAQLNKKPFVLEWIVPLEPGLSTHVTLYDLQCDPRTHSGHVLCERLRVFVLLNQRWILQQLTGVLCFVTKRTAEPDNSSARCDASGKKRHRPGQTFPLQP